MIALLLTLALSTPSITIHHANDAPAVRALVASAVQLLAPTDAPAFPIVVDAPGHQFDLVPPDQRAQLRARFRAEYGANETAYPAGALIGVRDPVIFLSLASDGIRTHDPAKVAALLVYANGRAQGHPRAASWREASRAYEGLLRRGTATDRAFLIQLNARAAATE